MSGKKILSLLMVTMLCTQIDICSAFSVGEEVASIKAQFNAGKEQEGKTTSKKPQLGWSIQYFFDQSFNLPMDMSKPQLSVPEAIRWANVLEPKQAGDYRFTLSAKRKEYSDIANQATIKIDGKTISQEATIKLEANKRYSIQIESVLHPDQEVRATLPVQVKWSMDGAEFIPIPDICLRQLSERSHKPNQSSQTPAKSLLQTAKQMKKQYQPVKVKDSDGDAIPDELEISGYTIKNKQLVPWREALRREGYTKYVSDPYLSHTAGDSYTDWEKVFGRMDKAIKRESRDPLIAACPAIRVELENLIISNVQDISKEKGKSISASVSDSRTHSDTAGADVKAGFSLFQGPSVEISGHYSHTGSTTATVENNSGRSWSEHLGINTGEAAYINMNIRYKNEGTAPVYNVQPTVNVVLESRSGEEVKRETLATVKAKENQLGDVLAPGETYPSKQQSPIALNTLDDFSSKLIPINYEQLQAIEEGAILRLEMTQAKGYYGVIDKKGNIYIDSSQEWEPVHTQIKSKTAGVILDTGTEVLNRRVAARKADDPEDTTPELTIEEAIQRAFCTKGPNGAQFYGDMPLQGEDVRFILDQSTVDRIKKQLQRMPEEARSIYKAKLEQGMNITIKKINNIHPTLEAIPYE